jgi:hypothetical protein
LTWINPWTGEYIVQNPDPEVLPGSDPGGGAPWIGNVNIWDNKMEAVTPQGGLDRRQKEDVFVIIKKVN